jgi:hypothetical protein
VPISNAKDRRLRRRCFVGPVVFARQLAGPVIRKRSTNSEYQLVLIALLDISVEVSNVDKISAYVDNLVSSEARTMSSESSVPLK